MDKYLLVLLGLAVLAVVFFLRNRPHLSKTVHEWEHGLLYVDGRFVQTLPAGRYWTFGFRDRLVVTVPGGPISEVAHAVDVTSQERLSFRLSATILYEVIDPRLAHEGNRQELLRLAASDAAVQLAASRSIETLLAERQGLGPALLALLGEPVAGCRITQAFVTAVTLPPELRRLYSEVERARLEGLAALERARGEQASLRSLANSARMLKGNPELMNLRLLQALSGSKTTLVLGRDSLSVMDGPGDEIA